MADTRSRAEKDAFLRAIEIPGAERSAFLADLAARDPGLARAVEGLLAAHEGDPARRLEHAPGEFRTVLRARSRLAGARLGDYELLDEVGEGAFGCVWRARQVSLDRVVAIKLLRHGPLAGRGEHERLQAEAEAVARLDHPHIVPVFEVGEVDGHAFFSMKWIEGGALAARLATPWAPRRAARLVVDIARAMHHAHQRGLLHRDLKPSNVLLDAEGAPHVADFGIAKRLDAAPSGSTGALLGTPAYMAPEQADLGELTVATDVWALGCILYELLAGRPAFAGASVGETLQRVRSGDPAPLRSIVPGIEPDLETIVGVCLRKDPARRYESASALADDLVRWLEHEPIAARRTGALERVRLFCRRSPLAATLIGLVAGLVLILAAVATWSSVELASRLRGQYVGQARATRLAGTAGARGEALDLLARAARIRRGEDVQAETVACLALSDVERESSRPRPDGDDGRVWIDAALRRALSFEEGVLAVVDAASGARTGVLAIAFDPHFARWARDGRSVAVKGPRADGGGSIEVWDVDAMARVLARDDTVRGRALELTPDGTRIVHATVANALVCVDVRTGAEAWRVTLDGGCNAIHVRPDGAEVALAIDTEPARVEFRHTRDGTLSSVLPTTHIPYAVAWLADGSFAVACSDGRARVFDAGTATPEAEPAPSPRVTLSGHAAEVVDVIPAPGGELLATFSWDGTSRVWDLLLGREIRSISARILGFDATGSRLATIEPGSWSTWRLQHGTLLRSARAHTGKTPVAVAISDDGRTTATGGADGVYAWDARSSTRPRRVSTIDAQGLAFLPGGSALVACGPDGTYLLDPIDPATPRRIADESAWDLAVSADGAFVAILSRDAVRVLDARTWMPVRELRGGTGLEFVSISADGSRVAAGNWRGAGTRVWDVHGAAEPRVIDAGQANQSAALSPDGALLSIGTSARVEVVRLSDGKRVLSAERQRVFGVVPGPLAWSRDGTRFAFGISSRDVRVVDARTFATLADLVSPVPTSLAALAFTPDGSRLSVASSVNLVQVWDLAALARELAARD